MLSLKVPDPTFPGILVGGIAGGVGNTIQIHTVGYAPNAYYVYKQVYNEKGQPLEGVYADLNGDGKITAEDRYRYKGADPKVYLGFSSQFSLNKLTLGFVLRGSLDNYVYNNVNSNFGTYRGFTAGNNYLSNVVSNVLSTGFTNNQYFSDYYIENASFLRMDNISLGYNVGRMMYNKINIRISAAVQNVFVLTNYKGLDPEVAGGVDFNLYPRPRTFSLGLNVGF